jgi:protein tyrosine phosphatase (PTP) superfamily phosphohydrolase (DUF442 family)
MSELWRRGFRTVVDTAGTGGDAAAAAAKTVGMKYVALPIGGTGGALDATKIDAVIKAISDPANQPLYLNSRDGRSTAAIWMIKRVIVDGWSIEQAGAEATAIGLVNDSPDVPALWKSAQDYIRAHPKK